MPSPNKSASVHSQASSTGSSPNRSTRSHPLSGSPPPASSHAGDQQRGSIGNMAATTRSVAGGRRGLSGQRGGSGTDRSSKSDAAGIRALSTTGGAVYLSESDLESLVKRRVVERVTAMRDLRVERDRNKVVPCAVAKGGVVVHNVITGPVPRNHQDEIPKLPPPPPPPPPVKQPSKKEKILGLPHAGSPSKSPRPKGAAGSPNSRAASRSASLAATPVSGVPPSPPATIKATTVVEPLQDPRQFVVDCFDLDRLRATIYAAPVAPSLTPGQTKKTPAPSNPNAGIVSFVATPAGPSAVRPAAGGAASSCRSSRQLRKEIVALEQCARRLASVKAPLSMIDALRQRCLDALEQLINQLDDETSKAEKQGDDDGHGKPRGGGGGVKQKQEPGDVRVSAVTDTEVGSSDDEMTLLEEIQGEVNFGVSASTATHQPSSTQQRMAQSARRSLAPAFNASSTSGTAGGGLVGVPSLEGTEDSEDDGDDSSPRGSAALLRLDDVVARRKALLQFHHATSEANVEAGRGHGTTGSSGSAGADRSTVAGGGISAATLHRKGSYSVLRGLTNASQPKKFDAKDRELVIVKKREFDVRVERDRLLKQKETLEDRIESMITAHAEEIEEVKSTIENRILLRYDDQLRQLNSDCATLRAEKAESVASYEEHIAEMKRRHAEEIAKGRAVLDATRLKASEERQGLAAELAAFQRTKSHDDALRSLLHRYHRDRSGSRQGEGGARRSSSRGSRRGSERPQTAGLRRRTQDSIAGGGDGKETPRSASRFATHDPDLPSSTEGRARHSQVVRDPELYEKELQRRSDTVRRKLEGSSSKRTPKAATSPPTQNYNNNGMADFVETTTSALLALRRELNELKGSSQQQRKQGQ